MNCTVFIPKRFPTTALLRSYLCELGVEKMVNHVEIFACSGYKLGTRLFFNSEKRIIDSLLKRQERENETK